MEADDIYVIGAGRLGRAVLREWRAVFPRARPWAETRRGKSDEALPGVRWRRRDEAPLADANFVLFSVPPRAAEDYAREAARALAAWRGPTAGGAALLISSTAVYAEEHGGIVREDSPLADHARAKRLLAAERVFLEGGGRVLRLAGLYSPERGPQLAYRDLAPSAESAEGWLNLIEESDAARLCVQALRFGKQGTVYLGADGSPLRRRELCEQLAIPCPFTGRGESGRRIDAGWTRAELRWQPRFPRFTAA